jgi:uncharacterized Zn finger protein
VLDEVYNEYGKYFLFADDTGLQHSSSCHRWMQMGYGVGARLDVNPMLFFELRGLDGQELVRKSMEQKLESMMKNAGKKSDREIADKDISDIFGL